MTTIANHTTTTTLLSQLQHQHPFLDALQKHQVSAEVMHVDHYRVKQGVAVCTNYIILVKPKEEEIHIKVDVTTRSIPPPAFEPFMMSKTYKAFQMLLW
ncbi:hypothetical protein ACA910_006575 [Epithemia clementina (nom. ined.)]